MHVKHSFTVKCSIKTESTYKHKMEKQKQACKLTRGFRCHLNCAIFAGYGVDDGLNFDDAASPGAASFDL